MRNEETWWSLIGIVVIAAVVEVVVVVVVRGTMTSLYCITARRNSTSILPHTYL
jgi:carbonic anhydrase/acetyltransferase-like protein (isoleucine patch superfamily)